MTESDPVMLFVPLARPLYTALEQVAQQLGRPIEDLVAEAIAAAITPATQLDLEALGQAMLDSLEMLESGYEADPLSDEDAAALLAALEPFVLPDDVTRRLLGEALIEQLTGCRADVAPTEEDGARLDAVTSVCRVLRGTLSEAEVRHWWTRRRVHLHGLSPAELLSGGGWTQATLAFREVAALAEGDAGSAAT